MAAAAQFIHRSAREPGPVSDMTKVGLWMVGALASFTTMAICGRELAGDLSTFQILFWRSMVGLVMISALLTRFGWGQIRTHSIGIHLLRNAAHFGGQFGWFFAIAMIPLVEVFALEFTTPIWTAVMASIFLRERLTSGRIVAIAIAFVGVLVILRPGLTVVGIGSLAALGAALGYATAHTTTRFLAQRDTPLCILFYMTVMQLPMGLVPALHGWIWPHGMEWFWLALVGITAMSAHYTLTRALKLAEAAVVVPIEFMRLPLIAVVGYVFYGEALEIWVGIGGVLVCGGILLNLRDAERRQT